MLFSPTLTSRCAVLCYICFLGYNDLILWIHVCNSLTRYYWEVLHGEDSASTSALHLICPLNLNIFQFVGSYLLMSNANKIAICHLYLHFTQGPKSNQHCSRGNLGSLLFHSRTPNFCDLILFLGIQFSSIKPLLLLILHILLRFIDYKCHKIISQTIYYYLSY